MVMKAGIIQRSLMMLGLVAFLGAGQGCSFGTEHGTNNNSQPIIGQSHQSECQEGAGLDDDVCYPETQFAIYNRLECPKEHLIMPEYAHEAMNVHVNDQVYNWLCGSEIPFTYVGH